MSSAEKAVEALEQGRADLIDVTLPGEDGARVDDAAVERLRVTAPGQFHDTTAGGHLVPGPHLLRPPFDNLQARRALNFALDRTKAIELAGGASLARLTAS